MSFFSKSLRRLPLFWFGIAAVFLMSIFLRFWQLGRFNTLVFDEVYYAKFANNYLTNTPFFDGHPPLSKYIIAIAMWIGSHLPIGQEATNSLSGSLRSTWSYRWLNALTGSLIPLVVAGIAYQLSYSRTYALIAALFAAADGLFLVESRYALNNVYLVIFGLLGQWCLLLALSHRSQKYLWLTLAGVAFGATISVKWNGLWFLLGAYFIWVAAWIVRWLQPRHHTTHQYNVRTTPLVNLTQINLGQVLLYLAVIPVAFYSIQWIPHLLQNPTPGFWEVQQKILSYHQSIGSGSNVHPYCSSWYTWLFMIRPVAYFYYITQSATDSLSIVGPPLPANYARVIYDVHAMGNPILWWLSTVGIVALILQLARNVIRWVNKKNRLSYLSLSTDTWIALYLVLNWLANLLPWVRVTRCTFLYHYMSASIFAELAIAWLVTRWLQSYSLPLRGIAVTIIFAILIAFVFWMPIYLGLPLTPEAYKLRMWSPTWI